MKNDVVRWNASKNQYVIKSNRNEESENSESIISDKTLKCLNVANNNASQQHVVKTKTTTTRNIRALSATNAISSSSAAATSTSTNVANNEERLWWGLQHQHQTSTGFASSSSSAFSFSSSSSSAIKCDNNNDKNFNENSNFLVLHTLKHSPRTKSRQCSYESRRQNRCHRHSLHHSRTFCNNHNNSLSVTNILLSCLQFSAVVFFCTINIGFALAANVGVPLSSAADIVEISPNGLVYDVISNDISSSNGASNIAISSREAVEADGHYTHTWAVHIPNGDQGVAKEVARDHGFVNLGKIFDDHYHFAHHKVSKRSLIPASTHQTRLDDDHRVNWAVQQKTKSRRKRDYIDERPKRAVSRAASLVDVVNLNDPKWAHMWYLNRGGGLDMNVIPAWKEGITGKGIVVTILDDGLESDHPDIEKNYDPKASYDVNSHDDDPMPHYDMTDSNRHGTRCAGEVAATANNSICAVGIAYGASVGGVRMLDGDVTDAVEARSLSLNPQHIDIYSASWGPDDDGKTVDGPGELASRAFIEGVTKGRNGKGSIFIWASGNGGRELDNCNCDGYTNSIWTLSISSATEEGHVPWYSEKCSSTLATTYSSGGQSEKQVVTTDLHHSCTVSHTGTSASAPLAAGIAALVLESNQNLTWRDLQHIVVRTAKPANLKDASWSKNGIGRRISHSFGYGLMDAAAMVRTARFWKTVPEQQRCEINAPHVDKVIPPRSYITLQLTVKHCLSVNYLEHVQAKITLTSQRRGDIQLYLKSPAGTKVTLLTSRVHDVSRSGFNQWPFMSVHTWGESPHGNWQLEIHNEGRYMAQITQWDLIFYGTEAPAQPEDPVHINPGQFGTYGNDMEHNDIEYDASGQWRNMQQIGESGGIMANDKTNTSCLKATIDQRCLDCAPPTYIFNGHCYSECPPHTYINSTATATANRITKTNEFNDNSLSGSSSSSASDIDDELQSTDRKRELFETDDMLLSSLPPLSCAICDTSCHRCYGPLNSQCSTCPPGSQLRKPLPHSNETYCYVFAERSSGNSQDGLGNARLGDGDAQSSSRRKPSKLVLFLLILVPAVVLTSLIVFLTPYGRNWLHLINSGNVRVGDIIGGNAGATLNSLNSIVTYDRVALLPDDEDDLDDIGIAVYKDEVGNFKPSTIEFVPAAADEEEDEDEVDLFDAGNLGNNLTLGK